MSQDEDGLDLSSGTSGQAGDVANDAGGTSTAPQNPTVAQPSPQPLDLSNAPHDGEFIGPNLQGDEVSTFFSNHDFVNYYRGSDRLYLFRSKEREDQFRAYISGAGPSAGSPSPIGSPVPPSAGMSSPIDSPSSPAPGPQVGTPGGSQPGLFDPGSQGDPYPGLFDAGISALKTLDEALPSNGDVFPRVFGAAQAAGGVGEIALGVQTILTPLGIPLIAHGLDQLVAGGVTAITGQSTSTVFAGALSASARGLGASAGVADLIGNVGDAGTGIGLSLKAGSLLSKADDAFGIAPSKVINCFPPETLVATEDGERAIGQVEAGERVWGYDFRAGAWRLCEVECRMDNVFEGSLITLHLDGGEVTATERHPFWVIQGDNLAGRPAPGHLASGEDEGFSLPGRWVDSHELNEGDTILLQGRGPAIVRGLAVRHGRFSVCNLTVRELHTYAVGTLRVLVHNASGSSGANAPNADAPLRYKFGPNDADWRGTGKTVDDALSNAFSKTGLPQSEFEVTKWGKDQYGKSFPAEWRHPTGAEVNIDFPHVKNGPDAPHVGWQTGGKRGSGGAQRGHTILDDVPYNR